MIMNLNILNLKLHKLLQNIIPSLNSLSIRNQCIGVVFSLKVKHEPLLLFEQNIAFSKDVM
jgi:hypothetical protein